MMTLNIRSATLVLAVFAAGAAYSQDTGTSTVAVNGGQIAYAEHGSSDGEPLVLIHGGFVADTFLPLAQEQALSSYRIIRPHLRGHGDSSPLPEDEERFGINEHADDILALLDALSIEQAVLVGNSLGGSVALQAALDAPERVSSLIIVEPGNTRDFIEALQIEREHFGREPAGPPQIPADREGRIAFLEGIFGGPENLERLPGAYEQGLGNGMDTFILGETLGYLWEFDTKTDLPKLHQPILFVHAQAIYALMAGWFWQNGQDVHTWHFENGHHVMFLEWPEQFAEGLVYFLDNHNADQGDDGNRSE
jgi:pimeloyl-ACP methyl ester carboxylesterase